MTKVIILGEQPKEQEKKKIEFVKCITIMKEGKVVTLPANTSPSKWKEIILLCENYRQTDLDLMFAHDFNINDGGCLYLGHFNDGII